MIVEPGTDRGTIRKRAGAPDERRRLLHESAVLRAAAHPGVARLVGVEGEDAAGVDSLVTRDQGSRDLERMGPVCAEVIAGLGAAVATTLADLHEIGVTHGAIAPGHVIVDDEGRPVLCGFGRASMGGPAEEQAERRRGDVADLARMLIGLSAGPIDSRLRAPLRLAAGRSGGGLGRRAGWGRRARRVDARWLARSLVRAVPDARLPDALGGGPEGPGSGADPPPAPVEASPVGPSPVGPDEPRGRRGRRRVVAALVTVSAAGALGVSTRPAPRPSHGASGPATPCPAADQGCIPVRSGVIATGTGRFRIEGPSGIVVVGRWACAYGRAAAPATPAELVPGRGQVWVFARWPGSGQDTVGRPVGRVSGAVSLRVAPSTSGCDRLEVIRQGGPPVVLTPVPG